MNWSAALPIDVSSYTLAQALFVRALGVVYFLAFFSLLLQVKGLYGKNGILPIRVFIDAYHRLAKVRPSQFVPSIFWFHAGDGFIVGACGLGVALSLLLVFGVLPPLTLLALLILYLSFVVVGQDFLSFQWDTLLLEVSYVGVFFSLATPPSAWVLIALWFLLFRFMFSSGIVKLLSGDRTWHSLSALAYHYETQPLPNRVSWHMHHLPRAFHQASAFSMFAIELVLPFFIFGPDAARVTVFVIIVALQLVLILTGNFGFFNYLTIALCIPLLPNSILAPILGDAISEVSTSTPGWLDPVLAAVGLFFIFINILHLVRFFFRKRWVSYFLHYLSTIHLTGSYGLFAIMTTSRPELIIEGSDDGEEWKPYKFRFQPQNVYEAPKQIAPLHPRLDWQMWFAALHPEHFEPWLNHFLVALLRGSKDVLRLLKANPFPEKPPRYIRVAIYDYRFSNPKTRQETRRWWDRELLETSRPVELKEHQSVFK